MITCESCRVIEEQRMDKFSQQAFEFRCCRIHYVFDDLGSYGQAYNFAKVPVVRSVKLVRLPNMFSFCYCSEVSKNLQTDNKFTDYGTEK